MKQEIMELVRDKMAIKLNRRLIGKVFIKIKDEDIEITVENYGFAFTYTFMDVYWAVHYGVTADLLSEDFIMRYRNHIHKRFFK